MAPRFDDQEHRAAARMERDYPGWAVLWGTHTRLYWGFPRFQAPAGTVIAAPDTAGLITRMQHAELTTRAHMPRPAGTAPDHHPATPGKRQCLTPHPAWPATTPPPA